MWIKKVTILSLMSVGLKINVKKMLGEKHFTTEVNYHI